MASYVEIRNANGNVIVDDQFEVAKFLYRDKFTTTSTETYQYVIIDGNTFKYQTVHIVKKFLNYSDLGFDPNLKWADVVSNLMLFARSPSGLPFRASLSMASYMGEDEITLEVRVGSDYPAFEVEFCLYTMSKMKPCSFGAQAFNANGELVFDAMRGYLQVIGSMYGGVNVWTNPAATYEMKIPEGLNMDNVFISHRSALPYFAAYKIGSGGVSHAQSYFYPSMWFKDSTTLVVDLLQQNPTGGNSASAYNAYYENVVYCPYPSGVWISGV